MKNQQSDTPPHTNESQPHTSEGHRSNLRETRGRMDETIDALASRFDSRHILDEVLGYFRSHRSNGGGSDHHLRERASDTAGTVTHAVVDAVRSHPLPAALIGTGIAWMIYERAKPDHDDYDFEMEGYYGSDPDVNVQEGLFEEDVAAGIMSSSEEGGSKMDEAKRRAGSAMKGARSKLSGVGSEARERGREGMTTARRRARRAGNRVQEKAQGAIRSSRHQLDRHPLEAGILSLAGGLVAGLLSPNPRALNEWAGPYARDLEEKAKERGREVIERGKHTASAAADTAQSEAKKQGLTPGALKEKASTVAGETRGAAEQTARQSADEQGISPESLKEKARSVVDETKHAAKESAQHESDEMRGKTASHESREKDDKFKST